MPENIQKVGPEEDIFPPILHSKEWKTPVSLPSPVSTAGLEDSPFITPDGTTLFFFFTPSAEIPAEGQLNDGVTGIYWAKKIEGQWQEPQRVILAKQGQVVLDGCPFYINETLWFCSSRSGNFRDIDFWSAEKDGEGWYKVKNAGERLNRILQVGELHLSSDGLSIFSHREDPQGTAGLDLWRSDYQGGEWQDPIPLEILNSIEDDSRPALSPNGLELWFTRTYLGTPAIYRSVFQGGTWLEPELIISRFAGEPSIDEFGNIYFVHHFFKDNAMIEADIYYAERNGK